ncbi:MAG TPA: xanthine dehydrogenase family protein molybdopterin-binding subunit [Acidobacteriota bacterium]|nr:xanthine dehydrogenase family protein molybdopterin-binding subunit [Acidobacteriota bacterium]
MADYSWPDASRRNLIGKRISRIDGPEKASGKAKYTQDLKRPGMLYGKLVTSPHAHAKVISVDTSAAEKMTGVKAVKLIEVPKDEVQWEGQPVAAVVATEEHLAEDAARAVKVTYELLPHLVREDDIAKAGDRAKEPNEGTDGDPDQGFKQAEVVTEGFYSIPVIAHCCLESHGSVTEWEGEDHLNLWLSTQAVSASAQGIATPLKIPQTNVHVHQDHIGGGFGSKFGPDLWDVQGALLAKMTGKPVKMMLDRASELMFAGSRPSTFAKVKVGAKKDGTILAWDSLSWGTGGLQGAGNPPIPYIWKIPNHHKHTPVSTNMGASRAWRAPNHPQACYITNSALEDLAADLKMDPLDLFLKNIALCDRADLYREEFLKAAEIIDWKKKWHQRGDDTSGHIKKGLGLSLHTWGGRGHASECRITINPDSSVSVELASQDLGTGTRTVINIVAADSLGLPLNAVKVNVGDSKYPVSGGSGGSTTVGGVSASTRRAAVDALEALFKQVAPALNADPGNLEAVGGKIRVKGDPAKSLSWKQACAKLGVTPISVTAQNKAGKDELTNSGVGGVQMAEVTVDTETGIVRIENMVAVQDAGYLINLKTAESQVYGAMIMGISYALYEEKVMDEATGRLLNPNMEFYKLAGIMDVGKLHVHMMAGPDQEKRGVIGLGEPPVVSPGAAIGNAVANAIGVRVPGLPLTPDRVLAALEKKGVVS